MSERTIEGYAISNQLFTVKLRRHYRVFRRGREPSRIPVRPLKCLRNKSRKLKEFVYERILSSIPKSSKQHCYIHMKVRKFAKINLVTLLIGILNYHRSNTLMQGCYIIAGDLLQTQNIFSLHNLLLNRKRYLTVY